MDWPSVSPENAWAMIGALIGLWGIHVAKSLSKKAAELPKSHLALAGDFKKNF